MVSPFSRSPFFPRLPRRLAAPGSAPPGRVKQSHDPGSFQPEVGFDSVTILRLQRSVRSRRHSHRLAGSIRRRPARSASAAGPMRTLLLIAILAGAFYLVLRKIRPERGHQIRVAGAGSKRLVQDPVCKVYILERDAKIATVGGRTFFFCSESCRKQYFKGQL